MGRFGVVESRPVSRARVEKVHREERRDRCLVVWTVENRGPLAEGARWGHTPIFFGHALTTDRGARLTVR
jgi:hypothetical protein